MTSSVFIVTMSDPVYFPLCLFLKYEHRKVELLKCKVLKGLNTLCQNHLPSMNKGSAQITYSAINWHISVFVFFFFMPFTLKLIRKKMKRVMFFWATIRTNILIKSWGPLCDCHCQSITVKLHSQSPHPEIWRGFTSISIFSSITQKRNVRPRSYVSGHLKTITWVHMIWTMMWFTVRAHRFVPTAGWWVPLSIFCGPTTTHSIIYNKPSDLSGRWWRKQYDPWAASPISKPLESERIIYKLCIYISLKIITYDTSGMQMSIDYVSWLGL